MTWYKYDMMRKIIKCSIDKFFKETRLFNSPLVLLSKGYLVSLSFFLFLPFFCSSLSLFLSLSLSLSLFVFSLFLYNYPSHLSASFLTFSTSISLLLSLFLLSISLSLSFSLSIPLSLSLSLSLLLSLYLSLYLCIS